LYNTIGSVNKSHASTFEAFKQHRCTFHLAELVTSRATSVSAILCLHLWHNGMLSLA
jgi:hypothetical protein